MYTVCTVSFTTAEYCPNFMFPDRYCWYYVFLPVLFKVCLPRPKHVPYHNFFFLKEVASL